MARFIVGLIGCGTGPRISIERHAKKLVAEVSGLKSDAHPVEGKVFSEEGEIKFFTRENGVIEIPVGHAVQFSYEGGCMPICAVRVS